MLGVLYGKFDFYLNCLAAAVASIRKKSLTWSENETGVVSSGGSSVKKEKDQGEKDGNGKGGESSSSLSISTADKRKGSRKSMDNSCNESTLDR